MKYAIITGASKGLGKGIAKLLLAKNINIIGLSRTDNEELKQVAREVGCNYQFFRCDLSSTDEITAVLEKVASIIFQEATEAVYVINNAGVVEPIETVGAFTEKDILQSISVNFTTPVFISNFILQKEKESEIPLVIVNITSGAGERAVHGWSLYGSTKAAINSFTKSAALELDNVNSIHKVIAFSPGMMDTEMQTTIRSATKEAFIDVEKFRDHKEQGALQSPDVIAEILVKLLMKEELQNGEIYYAKNYLKG